VFGPFGDFDRLLPTKHQLAFSRYWESPQKGLTPSGLLRNGIKNPHTKVSSVQPAPVSRLC
ncbi:MAG: hypothetical protein ACLTZW_04675, partial [Paratractidigestivibacter faecalis]